MLAVARRNAGLERGLPTRGGKNCRNRQGMPNGNPLIKEINRAISMVCAVNGVAWALQKFLRVICPKDPQNAWSTTSKTENSYVLF